QRVRTAAKFWDGEMFTLHVRAKRDWPQFQLIRSHNCGQYDVDEGDGWRDGIKRNGEDRALAYRFRLRGEDRYATVAAQSVVHSYLLEDSDQNRGVPPLSHGHIDLHDILDTLALEKEAVKELSRTARVI